MLLSVVLVVYNQLSLTRACLESLRATTAPFELCVVDNGSRDGTEAYFRRFPLSYPLRYERNFLRSLTMRLCGCEQCGNWWTRDSFPGLLLKHFTTIAVREWDFTQHRGNIRTIGVVTRFADPNRIDARVTLTSLIGAD